MTTLDLGCPICVQMAESPHLFVPNPDEPDLCAFEGPEGHLCGAYGEDHLVHSCNGLNPTPVAECFGCRAEEA